MGPAIDVRSVDIDNGPAMVKEAAPPSRPSTTPREDLVTVLLSTWVLVGVMLDGWAHRHLSSPESFLSPWHLVAYSGYVAVVGWVLLLIRRNQAAGRPWKEAIPAGYGLGMVGVLLLVAGVSGDLVWHRIFGVERAIAALLSPTHLALFGGVMLIQTSPYRAGRARIPPGTPPVQEFLPVLASAALGATMAAFLFQYLSMFVVEIAVPSDAPSAGVQGPGIGPSPLSASIATVLVTATIAVAPVLLLVGRWRVPRGSISFLFVAMAMLLGILTGYRTWHIVVAAVAAGILSEYVVSRLPRYPGRGTRYRLTAAIVPFLFVGLSFLAVEVRRGLGWPVEVWTGTLIFSALAGVGLTLFTGPAVLADATTAGDAMERVPDSIPP